MRKTTIALLFFILLASIKPLFAVTLNELIEDAKANYPLLKGQGYKKDAEYLRYKASFDPYYPSLDLSLGYNRYLQSEVNPLQDDKGYFNFSVNLGYKLYDPKRAGQKNAQNYSFLIEKQNINIVEKNLVQEIKGLYFQILAQKMILASRNDAFKSAEKTYELTQAKREVGLAKLSDVYQAKVRLENARLAIVTARNDLTKLLFEISSLCGRTLKEGDFDEELSLIQIPLKEEELFQIALEKRDELKVERLLEKRINEEKAISRGDFFPQVFASLSYTRYDRSFFPSSDETRFGLSFNWNLFSGMGKYYRYDALDRDVLSQRERYEERRRTILLEVKKAVEDFNSALEKVSVSEEILKSAEETYKQSFEEYRVGKGDILNLLQSEINLSSARESKISALLLLHQTKSALERAIGINTFEELK